MNLRVLGVIVVWPVAAGAATCESLKSLPLADTTITIAESVAAEECQRDRQCRCDGDSLNLERADEAGGKKRSRKPK